MRKRFLTKPIIASGGRQLTYLRLSVTDLCNLRCRYCMPPQGVAKLRHEDVLTYEEMLRLARIGAGLGLTKLRLTGGEPLVRRGLLDFIRRLKDDIGFNDLRLTTNGLLLPDMAAELKRSGLAGLNISLDALEPDIYAQMSGLSADKGRAAAAQAWRGFEAALEHGFSTKINCVPICGANDSQIVPLARLAIKYPVDVRFIEHMPVGSGQLWDQQRFVPSQELMENLSRELGPLTPLPAVDSSAPARRFTFPGSKGALGFISAMSRHFCGACNRLRLTVDGRLKPCLLTGREIDLRGPMRNGLGDEKLAELFHLAASEKPACHQEVFHSLTGTGREMNRIGG